MQQLAQQQGLSAPTFQPLQPPPPPPQFVCPFPASAVNTPPANIPAPGDPNSRGDSFVNEVLVSPDTAGSCQNSNHPSGGGA